jgi:hypothetical protein
MTLAERDQTMTEDAWRMYFADMGGLPASIVFNDGISARINDLPLVHAMKIRLPLKMPRGDGLTTSEESAAINALDEQFDEIIMRHGGEYLGRVTNNGARWVLALIAPAPRELETALQAVAAEAGYAPEIHVEQDPGKAVYWQDLYPSEDDRQVMVDMEVQRALIERGDRPEKIREIEHWSYFQEETAARAFAGWASDAGYADVSAEPPAEGGPPLWCVRMKHHGTLQLNDISGHSLAISRNAREGGGQYDGWESPLTL